MTSSRLDNGTTSVPTSLAQQRELRKRPRNANMSTTTTTTTTTTTSTTKRVVASSIFLVACSLPLSIEAWTTASRGIHTKPYETLFAATAVATEEPLSVQSLSDLRMSTVSKEMKRMASDIKMRQETPAMFLSDRFVTKAALTAASPTVHRNRHSGGGGDESSSHDRQAAQLQKPVRPTSRGVLGFDVFELEAHRSSSSSSAARSPSQVNIKSWNNGGSNYNNNNHNNFFPAPANQFGVSSSPPPFTAATSTTVPPALPGSSLAWLPWIPTKSQIESLKLTELREACVHRSLTKSGNKDVLQQRLWAWATEEQQQHQARLSGDFLVDWFEDMSTINSPVKKQLGGGSTGITKINGTDLVGNGVNDDGNDDSTASTPNSLGEWARTVDLDSLFEKRKNIHRQKLFGRPTPARQHNNRRGGRNNRNNPKFAADKDYLSKLSKALQAPSSPYSSNEKAKELYMASKKADQIGERKVAIDLLQTLIDVTPNDARVYRRLARMYSEQGDLSLARATLQRGLRKSPDNPWLWHGLGQLEISHGTTTAARKFFQRAIEVDPAYAHAYHALGTLEHTHGNIAKSMKILKQGIQYCPTNHRLHHALGDLYRGAKLLDDAERSYRKTLEHSPPVSYCFAYSALAAVAYEQGNHFEARMHLKKSVSSNEGRHAQGWLALAQMEEAEGNIDIARKVCALALGRYEKGLIERHQRHYRHRGPVLEKNGRYGNDYNYGSSRSMNNHHQQQPHNTNTGDDKVAVLATEEKERLLRRVPRYRPGDKFLKVYRNLARLEERHGSFESVDDTYRRASLVFPNEYKLTMDWASYYAMMRNHGRARTLYLEACNKALNRHADPYRLYAEYEMSIGNYGEARKILFRGAQVVSQSSDGGLGNRRGLAELFHTWALCEWHLGNLARSEVLFDHALRLTEAGEKGSRLRAFILYSIARLEHHRGKLHLAQHCVGLCLKETGGGFIMPGDNDAKVWELWADIARKMGNSELEKECQEQMAKADLESRDDDKELSRLLLLGKAGNNNALMRRDPWQVKLFGMNHNSNEGSENFYSLSKFPRSRDESLSSSSLHSSYRE